MANRLQRGIGHHDRETRMSSLPAAYFDALYDADPDPWLIETSAYDRRKHAATLAALPGTRYRNALEVGCSIGVLTEQLAPRCDRVLAIDVAEAALARARARLAQAPHVRFACRAFPGDMQDAQVADGFDLILLSEILYYLDAQALVRAARVTRLLAASGAHVQLVHWLGPTPDYPVSGQEAAEIFIAALRPVAPIMLQVHTDNHRIDVLKL
jgi:SAM-dependent methyltransferase